MSKSIIQTNKANCFICGGRASEEHHCIYGIANRKLSEKYGLKVYLCTDCHRIGRYAVHRCYEMDLKLKKIAQRKFEKKYPELSFLKIFRKKLFINERKTWSFGHTPYCLQKLRESLEGICLIKMYVKSIFQQRR